MLKGNSNFNQNVALSWRVDTQHREDTEDAQASSSSEDAKGHSSLQ